MRITYDVGWSNYYVDIVIMSRLQCYAEIIPLAFQVKIGELTR